jgi:hypothetical protein
MSSLTRTDCHGIARELLINARYERKPEAKRTLLRLSRTWVQLALVARRDGAIKFRERAI